MTAGDRIVAAAALALALTAGPAHADAIDGNWCSGDGRDMRIAGADIVTPSGTAMKGNYSRHAFSYIVPDTDPDPGTMVAMVLLNEMMVEIHTFDADGKTELGPSEIWRRCQPAVSLLAVPPAGG